MPKLLPFLVALQFLTRLPVRLPITPDDKSMGQSILYYPLVGLIIGIIISLIFFISDNVDDALQAALVLFCWTLLTGALHLDGLADTVDALAGGHGQKGRILQIMKDPAAGPMAVITLICVMLLQYSALISIQDGLVLIAIPVISRALVLLLFINTDYVREQGLGSTLKTHLPHKTAYWVLAISSFTVVMFLGLDGSLLIGLNLALLFYIRGKLIKSIGGFSGDVAGALLVLSETLSLVTVAIL